MRTSIAKRFLIVCLTEVLLVLQCSIITSIMTLSTYADEPYKRSRLIMGTLVEIQVSDKDKPQDRIDSAINKAFEVMERIDELMSSYKPYSEVSRLNRLKENERLTLGDDTFEVLRKSLEFARITSGAFDITVGPILELWGFYKSQTSQTPPEKDIKTALELVGYDKIVLEERTQRAGIKKEGMRIDLGGIAKGYAVDKAVESLKMAGINNALIEAGGDIYCLGQREEGKGWRIGIQHPRKKDELIATLLLKDMAVATSGDYARYPNIIDPYTGYPVLNNPMGVTVIAKDATTADALATAVFVLGRDGIPLLESIESVEVMIVDKDNENLNIETSSGFNKFLSNY